MTPTRKLALLAFSLLAALLLTLAACGGDDDDDLGDGDGGIATVTQDAQDGDTTPLDTQDADDSDDNDNGGTEGDDDNDDDDNGEGDDNGGSVAGDIDVCALVSDDEASGALGMAVAEGTGTDNGEGVLGCEWEAGSATEVGALYLEVRTGSDEDRQGYYDLLEEAEDVPGVGEQAKWNEGFGLFEVMGDDHYVSVQLINFGLEDSDVRQRSIDFATLVLGKLE